MTGSVRNVVVRLGRRWRALGGLAWTQLVHERTRTVVAVFGIALAVLAMTLLAGGGMGVMEVGQQQFDAADRDLWVTGGPLGLTPTRGGGFTNSIHDSHAVAADMQRHDDVRSAVPMSFQTVYVSENGSSFDTIVATGVPGGGSSVSITAGRGFSGGDRHYADGAYDGPMSHEVVVDERTARAYDLEVNDTLHVGGTLSAAREHEFTVVGVSPTFSQFLGTPTVTLPLSELQTITGTTGTDPATMITITVEDGADPRAVKSDLETAHPNYEIRTNKEQLEAVVGQQATVLVGAGMLVVLAFVTGSVLTVSLLALFVYQHRDEFATLAALGVSRRTVAGVVVAQGLFLGLAGWLLGALLTFPLAHVLNVIVSAVVGYDGLVVASPQIAAASAVIAIGMGTVASLLASWRLPRTIT